MHKISGPASIIAARPLALRWALVASTRVNNLTRTRAGCADRNQALSVEVQGGVMRKALAVIVSGLSIATFCTPIAAQQIPKSGSISWHTGWKLVAEALPVADKTMQGHGTVVGVTFNDKGAGPLHLGPAECFFTFFVIDGKGTNMGYCAFGDADGDRIFTEFTGKVGLPNGYDEGTNVIAGGTGKYAGITGSGPWKCKSAGTNGESQCTQRLEYRLP